MHLGGKVAVAGWWGSRASQAGARAGGTRTAVATEYTLSFADFSLSDQLKLVTHVSFEILCSANGKHAVEAGQVDMYICIVNKVHIRLVQKQKRPQKRRQDRRLHMH